MQRRRLLNVLACATAGITAALLSASAVAQGSRPHADTSKAFNGTSLAGWKSRGAAQWRAANGEIAGSAASGPGHLVLDKSYQDIVIEFAFQCQGCDAGVLLRDAAAAPNAGAFGCGHFRRERADAVTRVDRCAGQGERAQRVVRVELAPQSSRVAVQHHAGRERLAARPHPGARRCHTAAGSRRRWWRRRRGGVACGWCGRGGEGSLSVVRTAGAAAHRAASCASRMSR